MTAHYTREQEATLRRTVEAGHPPHCPECGALMDVQAVEPRPDVSYVRSRQWLQCGRCRRSLVLDRPRNVR